MATTMVETYHQDARPSHEVSALSPTRDGALEAEIAEIELIAQRDAAATLGLAGVVKSCEHQLARLRAQAGCPYPLLTAEEERVWRAFLPTVYHDESQRPKKPASDFSFFGSQRYLGDYAFDRPPLSVMQEWSRCRAAQLFTTYEVWTPEVVMPEPILVGYRMGVGPFLIARWGESLEPFEAIRKQVSAQASSNAVVARAMQQAQAGLVSPQPWGTFSGLLSGLGL